MKKIILSLLIFSAFTHNCHAEKTWGQWFSDGITWIKETVTAPFNCKKCSNNKAEEEEIKKQIREDLVNDEISGEVYE